MEQAALRPHRGQEEGTRPGHSGSLQMCVSLQPGPLWPGRPHPSRCGLGGAGGAGWSHLLPVPPAGVPPGPSAPTAAAPAPARSHAGSGSGCATARPRPWGHGVHETGSLLVYQVRVGVATEAPAGEELVNHPAPACTPNSRGTRSVVSVQAASSRVGGSSLNPVPRRPRHSSTTSTHRALAGARGGASSRTVTSKRVEGSILGRGTCLGCGFHPWQPVSASLSH